jgi:hypothetical protein
MDAQAAMGYLSANSGISRTVLDSLAIAGLPWGCACLAIPKLAANCIAT